MPISDNQYIIAIGASAGGMEEINQFFDNTPPDGVSYVIVQHLSPDFKSRMAEVLAKHSELKIQEAEEGMQVEMNRVYTIPSKKFMTISDGMLHLTEKEQIPAPHLTINTFFKSLAEERGKMSIGVILSGMGSDGSEGVKAIKEAGGMIIARDPYTTEFPSMPSNAINTGVVDYILEPEVMPDAIIHYVDNKGIVEPQVLQDEHEEKIMLAIIALIKDSLPVDFSDYKQTTILRRIKRRAAQQNFVKLEKYLSFLQGNQEELKALAHDFLISVTSFFRDKEAFEIIESTIIPEIIKLNKTDEIKIWVAGCATGEEAYSLAIFLKEQLPGELKDLPVKIFATDIDAAAISHASRGLYSESILKYVSQERLERFFVKEGKAYRVNNELRKMLIFAPHDLVKNPPYCNMDLITCRNLLIYMTPILQKKIYLMLQFGLKKNGYLFLGPSEHPYPIVSSLEVIDKKWRIYKNLETKRVLPFDAFSLPALIDLKDKSFPFSRSDKSESSNNNLAESANEVLMKELGYLALCIDEKNTVVQTYGDTTKYLLQKNFSLDLAELLPEPLQIAFENARQEVLQTDNKVNIKGIKIETNQSMLSVNLLITPLPVKKEKGKLLLAVFSEDIIQAAPLAAGKEFEEKLFLDQYTKNIREELKETRAELHSSFEKLEGANENMQSFSEELLSANEEMQSTNEEMQSVNEELHTINADYQLKNKELIEINDDLSNYFRSNINGQLFVDKDINLMKYSPGTVKHINLLQSDIGRPLSNISTNIKFETIIQDIKEVIDNGGVIIKEVEANNGKWYQLMTMPYIRQSDHKNSGAIISFHDITELKNTQTELDKSNKSLKRVNADLDNFVHTASHDLLAPLANIELSISVMNEIKVADPKLKTFLDVINTSVKKFSAIIKDMAAIGRIENEMQELEHVDLTDIINDIKFSLQNQINSSGAEINTALQVKEVVFSKKNLRSIMYNLISNAIKYKKDEHNPEILISSTKEDGYIHLSVKDNGIGISQSGIDKIFKMYTRLNKNVDGQGIGLHIAKKIVDAAGGDIIVESKPSDGSTFTILFKAEDAAKGVNLRKYSSAAN